jgi:hypothetical protein
VVAAEPVVGLSRVSRPGVVNRVREISPGYKEAPAHSAELSNGSFGRNGHAKKRRRSKSVTQNTRSSLNYLSEVLAGTIDSD